VCGGVPPKHTTHSTLQQQGCLSSYVKFILSKKSEKRVGAKNPFRINISKEEFHILLTGNQQFTDDISQHLQVQLIMLKSITL